ncbi:hypothetical protein CRENBAI_003875 [Crenichthys baileyi]|uniref:SWIM-type domain-containing protein n=1 Tax=Crenichthys baileyi TaxID=28760 RepID=A0AAV9SQL2_9TELE
MRVRIIHLKKQAINCRIGMANKQPRSQTDYGEKAKCKKRKINPKTCFCPSGGTFIAAPCNHDIYHTVSLGVVLQVSTMGYENNSIVKYLIPEMFSKSELQHSRCSG